MPVTIVTMTTASPLALSSQHNLQALGVTVVAVSTVIVFILQMEIVE
jgi:hypothetical protein